MSERSSGTMIERERRVASLLAILVPREIRLRYRRSVFDLLWAVISPVVILTVYGLILTRSFDVTAACSPYLSSAWTGLVMWTFFAAAVGGASYSLLSAGELLTKVYFPREALPLAVVGASMIDLLAGAVVGAALIMIQGVHPGATAVWAILPVAVLIVWSAVFSVAVATLSVFVRDTVHGVQLGLRAGFFATPVMYEADFLPPVLAWTEVVNPVAVAIDGVRTAVLCSDVPNLGRLAAHLVAGSVCFVAITYYVRSVESRISDVV